MVKRKKEELKNMKYEDFLQTDYWKMVSEQARINAHNKCQVCGCNDKKLHVHHNTYEHHGEEHKHMEDLVCLCEDCHYLYHNWSNIIQKLQNENSMMKMQVDNIQKTNDILQEERDYAEWKLMNFYKAQNNKENNEWKYKLRCMVTDNLIKTEENNDDLPF